MKQDSKYPWYILDLFIFTAVNAVVIWLIYHRHLTFALPSVWLMIIFALAVFRLADIISNETITEPLRAPFVNIKEKQDKEVEVPKRSGFRGATGFLLYCPACTGTWVAMILIYFYIFWPHVAVIIGAIFALSGMERILTSLTNVLKKTPQVLDKIE
jgi:energy-coupling factor transporter transmembrane protein EcfT